MIYMILNLNSCFTRQSSKTCTITILNNIIAVRPPCFIFSHPRVTFEVGFILNCNSSVMSIVFWQSDYKADYGLCHCLSVISFIKKEVMLNVSHYHYWKCKRNWMQTEEGRFVLFVTGHNFQCYYNWFLGELKLFLS